ncbi:hypothetical protein K280104A7_32020 [Candidatus Bariatricus faecipullorum]
MSDKLLQRQRKPGAVECPGSGCFIKTIRKHFYAKVNKDYKTIKTESGSPVPFGGWGFAAND